MSLGNHVLKQEDDILDTGNRIYSIKKCGEKCLAKSKKLNYELLLISGVIN